jgi:CRP/FNR family transcriptional regulator, cyclic AMP receptor protein
MVGGTPATGAFLDRLGPADRAVVLSAGRPRRYRPGENIFVAGHSGSFVVLITEGRAKVTAPSPTGSETVLSLRGPGDLIGELTAIDDEPTPRVATVVAVDAVVCRVVRVEEFRAILAAHPAIALELVRMVASRLRTSDRRLVEFGAYDITRRVALLLADMAATEGRPPGGTGVTVPGGLSQDDLAGLVGGSRESVARALGALRSLGLVSTGRRRIVVLDLERLRDYAVDLPGV